MPCQEVCQVKGARLGLRQFGKPIRARVKLVAMRTRQSLYAFFVEQAVRTSINGRPGAVYLDLPNDLISARLDEDSIEPAIEIKPVDVDHGVAAGHAHGGPAGTTPNIGDTRGRV